MRVNRIIADLVVTDIEAAKGFYTDYLGLTDEEFNLGWVARYTSRETGANVQLLTSDVDAAYEESRARGYEIVHPLTTEAWGVRRFFVRDGCGNVLNVVGHPD